MSISLNFMPGTRGSRSIEAGPGKRWPKATRIVTWILAMVIVLLLLVRFVGSPIATSILNKRLAALPGYPGHVGAVQLALWRGKVTATDFTLTQSGHEQDGPVLKVARGAFTLAPLALLRGKIAGRIGIGDVDVLMIQEPPKPSKEVAKADKKEKEADHAQGARAWEDVLQKNLPIEMTRLEVTNLKVKFVDRGRALSPQMLLEKVHIVAHDFKTKPANSGDLPASLKMEGHFPGGGDLTVNASGDATSSQPMFRATMGVKQLALPPLHDFLQSYALVDVTRGTFELYVEVAAQGGHYEGYLKPFFQELQFKAVPDPEKNLAQRVVVKVASGVQNLLKNDEGKVATKAPFKGDFANNQVDLMRTVENLLRNAFVTAIREGFEGQKPNG
ncbi:MAG: hypothetical protein JWM32_664 [Verrucomicrobia bacterium]|nr:hypothetical protein [Verrucomicrobiota bacterium]